MLQLQLLFKSKEITFVLAAKCDINSNKMVQKSSKSLKSVSSGLHMN